MSAAEWLNPRGEGNDQDQYCRTFVRIEMIGKVINSCDTTNQYVVARFQFKKKYDFLEQKTK